ncbi:MAG: LamG domain-containing protein, partial [Planctomycetes bacterium]|nr:LamG domain-containing protein [Planctomycetota bacterium]
GGSWSAPLHYDNTGTVVNSEVTRTYSNPLNFTGGGIKVLTLFFYGQQSNSAPSAGEQMYVKLNGAKVVYDGDMADITREQWHQWDIDLASFGVNLSSVTTISIGFDRGTNSVSGLVYFDDILLYSSKCVPSRRKPAGDLNNDCRFDPWDIQILTNNWLISTYEIDPTDPGTANLIGHWPLDEGTGLTTADVAPAGYANHGDLVDGPMWTTGHDGGNAISFDGIDDYVVCAERFGDSPGTYPAELMPSTFTVSCWAKLDNFVEFSALVGNGMDYGANECGFFFFNYGYSTDNGRNFGLSLETGDSTSDAQYVETASLYETDTWYHLAATYDGQYAAVYVDGELAAGPQDVGGPIKWIDDNTGNYPERFAIGVWLDPDYELWSDGTIDEVRYYSRALTHGEIGWLAGEGSSYVQPLHLLLTPTNPEINAYDGDAIPIIDFKDFAALAADAWLDYQLWP